MADADDPDRGKRADDLAAGARAEVVPAADEQLPPVVARMVIEIRSDGSRTIARGAIEDVEHGQRVDVRAEAESPVALAWKLARSLVRTPSLAARTVRALLPGRRKR